MGYYDFFPTSKASTAKGIEDGGRLPGPLSPPPPPPPPLSVFTCWTRGMVTQDSNFRSKAAISWTAVCSSRSKASNLWKQEVTLHQAKGDLATMLTYTSLCLSLKATMKDSMPSIVCFSFSTTREVTMKCIKLVIAQTHILGRVSSPTASSEMRRRCFLSARFHAVVPALLVEQSFRLRGAYKTNVITFCFSLSTQLYVMLLQDAVKRAMFVSLAVQMHLPFPLQG